MFYVAPGVAEIRPVTLDLPVGETVLVRTLATAISRGTERLVASGGVPESEHSRMRAPFQTGDFPFPVKYGYAAVGVVEEGPEALLGQRVFSLYPHQTHFRVPLSAALPVPASVPTARACLAANMETALNALWDGSVMPGSRVLVLGAGLVGCLIAALIGRRADVDLVVCDILPHRNSLLADFNVTFMTPDALVGEFQKVFHASASQAGLQLALDCCAFEGEVIELSWYGANPVAVQLGGAFHAKRLTLRASQVGHVAPAKRATTSHRDRLAAALVALEDPRLDAFLTDSVSFEDLPAAIPGLLAPGAAGIATVINYE
ncbi:MAG: zinc-binding alcohol dehydrogenase [Pseudomonadota bacterium]